MSSQDAVTIGTLLNVVGLGFLLAAQRDASRDRDRRERASGERPQSLRPTQRARVLMAFAVGFVGIAAAFLVGGFVTG